MRCVPLKIRMKLILAGIRCPYNSTQPVSQQVIQLVGHKEYSYRNRVLR